MKNNENNKRKKGAVQRNLLIALCVVLAVVLIVLTVGTVYVHSMLGRLGQFSDSDRASVSASEADRITQSDPELETIDPDSTEDLPELMDDMINLNGVGHNKHGSHVINILLVGQDRKPGETGRQRSDSMILLTLNKSKNTLTMTSFMRDQYVDIPGYQPNKLNAAYAFGGYPLLNKTLERNFGVHVDHNVEVDFEAFTKVIDRLGGVEITLTQAEVDFMMQEYYGHSGLVVGSQLLSGAEALTYSRNRSDTDYKRAERQRNVLTALLERYRKQPVSDMLSILNEILPDIKTDMDNSEILELANELLPLLSGVKINNLRIPVDGTFDQGEVQVREGLKNWFQYNIDFKANYQRLQMLFEQ